MKKSLFYILFAATALCGCEGFLTEEPKLTQSNELTLSNYDGLNKATAGAYSPLYAQSWYGAQFNLSADLRGGNAKNPTNADFTSGRYKNEYFWSFSPSTTSGLWNYAYYVISAANNVIDNLDGKDVGGITKQDLDNLKAECLFLRALGHFDLVRVYAQPYSRNPETDLGVPYIKHTLSGAKPARDKVNVVYESIIEDLLEAERIMADKYVRSGVTDPKGTVTKPAIQALLSRVYLYMGNWQKAADYATLVIKNAGYSLWEKDEYKSVWGEDVTKGGEIIFCINGNNGNSYYPGFEEISWIVNPEGYADVVSTSDLRDLYEDDDVRSKLFISHENAQDHFWTLKYPGKGLSSPDANNIVVLRLSEMYLNRAEAIYKGATITGVTALDDLNAIAEIRGASPYDTPDAEKIFNERRKELAFEGHIVFDYARLKKSLTRVDYDGTDNKTINFPDNKWAMPIPKGECDANPNMVQNP